jgi:hypothetical protein
MERSDDKMTEAEVSLFDQTLDEALEQMLTEGEHEETKEDVDEEDTETPDSGGSEEVR